MHGLKKTGFEVTFQTTLWWGTILTAGKRMTESTPILSHLPPYTYRPPQHHHQTLELHLP